MLKVFKLGIGSKRFLQNIPFLATFENVVFPANGEYKLPEMPKEPTYDASKGEEQYKTAKRMIDVRGVEEIHCNLLYNQYGLAAESGGFIHHKEFAFVQTNINSKLLNRQFAVWRVPAPWLPRTMKGQGKRLGGGKGNIKEYVTPVRQNRIILELGGHIAEFEALAYLSALCRRFTFPVEVICAELLENRRKQMETIMALNVNKFNWDLLMKYNMQDCRSWLSPYDILWKGQYR